jgi:hypothetical protein
LALDEVLSYEVEKMAYEEDIKNDQIEESMDYDQSILNEETTWDEAWLGYEEEMLRYEYEWMRIEEGMVQSQRYESEVTRDQAWRAMKEEWENEELIGHGDWVVNEEWEFILDEDLKLIQEVVVGELLLMKEELIMEELSLVDELCLRIPITILYRCITW